MLSTEQARQFYDRFGARQDRQAFYEDAATGRLTENLPLDQCRSVLELGCGTGRFAASLLSDRLPADATYLGLDISSTMVNLARERLAPWHPRAEVRRTGSSAALEELTGPFDLFVSNYVLDLLPDAEIDFILRRVRQLLAPDGHAGLVSLAPGTTPIPAAVTAGWRLLHRLRPSLVGGCRPLELRAHVNPARWRVDHASHVTRWGLTSEVRVLSPDALETTAA